LLGAVLSKVQGKTFRIGHPGSFNNLMLVGNLGGVEMGLWVVGAPPRDDTVMAALEQLARPFPRRPRELRSRS